MTERPAWRRVRKLENSAKRIDEQEITRDRVSNFIQTPVGQRAHPSRIMEGAMHDLQRYRDSAAECLLAAEEHANLTTANLSSLWPPHGSRSLVRMRQ